MSSKVTPWGSRRPSCLISSRAVDAAGEGCDIPSHGTGSDASVETDGTGAEFVSSVQCALLEGLGTDAPSWNEGAPSCDEGGSC